MECLPIGDYALLSDCRSAALVSRDGSVDWLCFPRFYSPAVFARILDPGGGHFSIRPAGDFEASRAYAGQAMALETTFAMAAGTAVLTEAMAVGRNERGHDLGAGSPGVLLRRLACTAGEVDIEASYAPRPEYALIHPILEAIPGGVAARGGAGRLLLSAPAGFGIDGATATAYLHLEAGQQACFALAHAQAGEPPLPVWDPDAITARLEDTVAGWRSWSAIHQTYEGPWRELVHHSGRVLQALTFAPTGAIVAAATTSLPETAGGERNWDYRYTAAATSHRGSDQWKRCKTRRCSPTGSPAWTSPRPGPKSPSGCPARPRRVGAGRRPAATAPPAGSWSRWRPGWLPGA
jgi:GH15 family glucan-1,4-alpha-glucosidase